MTVDTLIAFLINLKVCSSNLEVVARKMKAVIQGRASLVISSSRAHAGKATTVYFPMLHPQATMIHRKPKSVVEIAIDPSKKGGPTFVGSSN